MRAPTERILILMLAPLLPWSMARAETCEATLQLVQQLYNKTVDVCPDGELAADCAGVLLRGTRRANPAQGQSYNVWELSPNAKKQGSFAASYIRKDINFDDPPLGYNNGFFVTPKAHLCANQTPVHLQCAFVGDGWTDTRADRGCGDNTLTPQVERFCQDSGVTTGAAWLTQFNANLNPNGASTGVTYQRQCGFDLARTRGKAGRATAFKTFMDARRLVGNREFMMQNEVRLSDPAPGITPVLAFFSYNALGKAEALANQRDYYMKTGLYRPVINMTFPRYPGDVASFACEPTQMPPPVSGSTPGFCSAGKTSSTGFSTTTTPIPTAAQATTQATQAAQAAAQAAQAAQASAQVAQMVQATQAAQYNGQPAPSGSGYDLASQAAQAVQAAQAAQMAQTAAQSAAQAAQAAQAAGQSGQASQAVQAAQVALVAGAQAAQAAAAATAAQAAAGNCSQYIASARWIQRQESGVGAVWSLSITPTECGRKIGPDQSDAMYAELYGKFSQDWQWGQYAKNYGSMRRQMTCHLVQAREKQVWNLEPRRRYVDHEASMRLPSMCNPPFS